MENGERLTYEGASDQPGSPDDLTQYAVRSTIHAVRSTQSSSQTAPSSPAAPPSRADLAIDDDTITAIGLGLAGERTIDATGCYVIPGGV